MPRQPLWERRESWIILFCALLVALLVLAAIGYYSGAWEPPPT